MQPTLTLFFIVEPPTYQNMACYLAASIRKHMPEDVVLVGYCPQHRMDELNPSVVETLQRLECPIRTFDTHGQFDPAYPHGNKILAALEPRETQFSGFLDSDVLLIRDNSVSNLIRDGHVSASAAASMRWGEQTVWNEIYGAFNLPLPTERIRLMRDKREAVMPYYSSGFVLFPEGVGPTGQRFAQTWMETAQTIDRLGLPTARPYLDQMSLPVAIRRAGYEWFELEEKQHYILGGSIRGKPLPKDLDIHTVHYRKWDVLKEAGLHENAYDYLREKAGASRINWVPKAEKPDPSDKALTPKEHKPKPNAQRKGPDPSKARMAAVTMVHEDYFFLDRWVRYWSEQIGREHLYVLCHGEDPRIHHIAKGANILHVPRTDNLSRFDRRRWQALSNFTSGLTLYYNWVICNDVDEIVAVDPSIAGNIAEYLDEKFASGAPMVVSPFAIEIVHTPASEPEIIAPATPILSVRRNFRINSNYAKPCITRGRIQFSIGGHGCAREKVLLDDSLMLFHLRYVDDTLSRTRLSKRLQFMEEKNGTVEENKRRMNTWEAGVASFERLSAMTPSEETANFPDVHQKMVQGRNRAASGNWFFGKHRTADLYRLPERFKNVF